jgi:hypothetical protein
VSYVAMLEDVHESFVDTIISAQGLDATTVEKGWSALVTVGLLAAAIFFGLYWSHHADQEMRKTRPDKKEQIGGSAPHSEKLGFFARWFTKPERKRPLNRKSRGIDKDVQIAEQALPAILRSNEMSQRVADELKHHHKYMGIVFFFSTSFPRTLRVLSLASNVIIMLFMQSLTYSLTNPDDGLCETYQSQPECIAPKSPYATGESKCYWTVETNECALVQPDSSLKVVLFVAIFSALLSTPLALTVDWVIMSVLAAPTKQAATAQASGQITPRRSQVHQSGRRAGLSLSQSAKSSPSIGAEETRPASLGDKMSVVRSPTRSSRVLSSLTLPSWHGTSHNLDVADQFDRLAAINNSAQNDLRSLVADLLAYRSNLVPEEKIEFDGKSFFLPNGSCFLLYCCCYYVYYSFVII